MHKLVSVINRWRHEKVNYDQYVLFACNKVNHAMTPAFIGYLLALTPPRFYFIIVENFIKFLVFVR